MPYELFDVLAPGHTDLPDTESFPLSDIDPGAPGNHTVPCIVFSHETKDQAERDTLVQHLRQGLANVLACVPLMGGYLVNEPDGRMSVLRHHHEPIQLCAHYLEDNGNATTKDGIFPTYDDLEATDFSVSTFTFQADQLVPPKSDVLGLRQDTGCPVGAFQVTFLRGGRGIVLVSAIHHIAADGRSVGHLLRFWAESTRASIASNTQMPSFVPVLDRTYCNSPTDPTAITRQAVEDAKTHLYGYTYETTDETEEKAGGIQVTGEMPPVALAMFHFAPEHIAALKRACWPDASGDVTFVSTYDVVCGLAWRCMTRARFFDNTDNNDNKDCLSSFSHPVDSRGRLDDSVISPNYFGNGTAVMWTEPILLSVLVGPDGLAAAAQNIRKATNRFTAATIPALALIRRGVPLLDHQTVAFPWLPHNQFSTSWTNMVADPVVDLDFGFGAAVALRLRVPPFAGIAGLLPPSQKKTKTKGGGMDRGDGVDMYVVVEAAALQRLREDPEMQKYAEEMGV